LVQRLPVADAAIYGVAQNIFTRRALAHFRALGPFRAALVNASTERVSDA